MLCANSNTPPPACQVLTNSSPSQPKVISGGILRLTTANTNQRGSAWYKTHQPLASGFTTAFQFQISSTNSCFSCSFPADGLAVVIQNDPSGTGALGYTGNGQNLAYGNNDISTASGPGAAILNSLAIELDTQQNSNYSDPDGNHIAPPSPRSWTISYRPAKYVINLKKRHADNRADRIAVGAGAGRRNPVSGRGVSIHHPPS